jgi:hypothetical protein
MTGEPIITERDSGSDYSSESDSGGDSSTVVEAGTELAIAVFRDAHKLYLVFPQETRRISRFAHGPAFVARGKRVDFPFPMINHAPRCCAY